MSSLGFGPCGYINLSSNKRSSHTDTAYSSPGSLWASLGSNLVHFDAGPGAAGEPHWTHGDRETELSWGSAGSRKERKESCCACWTFPRENSGSDGQDQKHTALQKKVSGTLERMGRTLKRNSVSLATHLISSVKKQMAKWVVGHRDSRSKRLTHTQVEAHTLSGYQVLPSGISGAGSVGEWHNTSTPRLQRRATSQRNTDRCGMSMTRTFKDRCISLTASLYQYCEVTRK